MDMNTMHPQHLQNAMDLIASGGHEYYTVNDEVFRTGLQILNREALKWMQEGAQTITALKATITVQNKHLDMVAEDTNHLRVKNAVLNTRLGRLTADLHVTNAQLADVKKNNIVLMDTQHKKPKARVEAELEWLRQIAVKIIRMDGQVSADTLRRAVEQLGVNIDGQRYQAVFRDARFTQNMYKRSDWKPAQGRFINTWVLA